MRRRQRRPGLPGRVAEVLEQVEQWRRTRERRTRMPESLWDAAVGLAQEHGVFPIAHALRLNYPTLKYRVTAAEPARHERGGTATAVAGFIELPAVQRPGEGPRSEMVVELMDAGGAKMTVRVAGGDGLDVAGLARAFWSRVP